MKIKKSRGKLVSLKKSNHKILNMGVIIKYNWVLNIGKYAHPHNIKHGRVPLTGVLENS